MILSLAVLGLKFIEQRVILFLLVVCKPLLFLFDKSPKITANDLIA